MSSTKYVGEPDQSTSFANSAGRFPTVPTPTSNGLCKVATIEEIEAQAWSLNPGRYLGTEVEELDEEVFVEKLADVHAELYGSGARARELEEGVDAMLGNLLSI